jgi:hypothetical protein
MARTTPSLVVLVVVDQFRGDYIQRYGHTWTKGLRRLVDHGAYFPLAAYPYSGTLTCAGHATIGTGAFPRTHGMIANAWYDRDSKKSTACTADASAVSVPFGGRAGIEHHSAKWLLTTTFADELRNQLPIPPRITSVSLKARSAIGMAGHGGDLVMWEEDDGTWATSSAYAKSARADVDTYAKAHPVDAQYGRVWDRLLPPAAYLFPDDSIGEPKYAMGTRAFPHALTRAEGKPTPDFVNDWERSPFSDEALADLAITFSEGFGTGAGTDMLAVSFSASIWSATVWPEESGSAGRLARLDVQIGRLFDASTSGRRQPHVVASADHGWPDLSAPRRGLDGAGSPPAASTPALSRPGRRLPRTASARSPAAPAPTSTSRRQPWRPSTPHPPRGRPWRTPPCRRPASHACIGATTSQRLPPVTIRSNARPC